MNKDVLRERLSHFNSHSHKNGVYTVRQGFFYKMGRSTEDLISKVNEAFPGCVIVDSGEHYASFRGGQTVAQGSHWWVKFTLPEVK